MIEAEEFGMEEVSNETQTAATGLRNRGACEDNNNDRLVRAEVRSWIENVIVPSLVDRYVEQKSAILENTAFGK